MRVLEKQSAPAAQTASCFSPSCAVEPFVPHGAVHSALPPQGFCSPYLQHCRSDSYRIHPTITPVALPPVAAAASPTRARRHPTQDRVVLCFTPPLGKHGGPSVRWEGEGAGRGAGTPQGRQSYGPGEAEGWE